MPDSARENAGGRAGFIESRKPLALLGLISRVTPVEMDSDVLAREKPTRIE